MKNELFKSILIDIEGTTVPISFVKEILFPYVRKHLRQYLEKDFLNNDFQEVLHDLSNLSLVDITLPSINLYHEKEKIIKDTLDNVFYQMDSDMKTTALKKLQGLVWKSGYVSKQLQGEVFPDVVPVLKKWKDDGINLYIYSSGSVNAQKLLFKYSNQGDMLEFFKGHFDTAIGSKIEKESYLKIAEEIKTVVEDILFLTDSVNEARAATLAGIKTVLLIRPGNQDLPCDIEFECVKSFEDISVFK